MTRRHRYRRWRPALSAWSKGARSVRPARSGRHRPDRAWQRRASRRRARRERGRRCRRGCGSVSSSKGLPDADIDAVATLAVLLLQRDCEIKPDRTDAGMIAQTEPGGEAQSFAEIRIALAESAAGIDEGHDADRIGDADARLDRAFDQRATADRDAVAHRTEAAIGIATYRSAATGEETPVGRNVPEIRPHDGAETDTCSKNVAGAIIKRILGRQVEACLQHVQGRAERSGVRCHAGTEPNALGRLQPAVGRIEFKRERDADEAVIALARVVFRNAVLVLDPGPDVERVREAMADTGRHVREPCVETVRPVALDARIGEEIIACTPQRRLHEARRDV